MTADELVHKFNTEFGLGKWPKSYEVDSETYGNCCQKIFNWLRDNEETHLGYFEWFSTFEIALGKNNGIMFKNVELIIK